MSGWKQYLPKKQNPKIAPKEKDNAILEVRPDGKQVIRFKPVSALAAPDFMKKLCRFYHQTMDERKAEPLLAIASFVFDFECVHPFLDGNGRMGRLKTDEHIQNQKQMKQ